MGLCLRPEPVMTLPRSVADVLDRHVTFELESIDRMYLNVYQPLLQYPRGAAGFFHFHRGHQFASSALMAPMTKAFVAAIGEFIDRHGLDLVHFAKDQRKDDVTQAYLADHDGAERVLYVGRAQEKASVVRTERRYDARTGASYAWLVKASALVNHFYFYCFDGDFGPFFIKFCSYFPYNAKLCLNGHEWAKRQAAKAGLAFTPLDNAFAAVADPARLQVICDQLGAEQIDALLRRWLAILPHPFSPADRRLLGVQRLDHDPIHAVTALAAVTEPVTTPSGTRIPGLRLGQARSHALLSALLIFRLQPAGFTNRDLRALTAQLRGLPPD